MEPVSLTCPKCGAAWKLIKAGQGPITCPKCKATLDGAPAPTAPPAAPVESKPAPPTPAPAPAAPPTETYTLAALSAVPPMPLADTDDPALRADYDDRPELRRRRGMAPLLKVALILLLLMILLPLAAVVLLFVVCAVMSAKF